MSGPLVQMNLKVPKALKQKVEKAAKEEYRSIVKLVCKAIDDYLEPKHGDRYETKRIKKS